MSDIISIGGVRQVHVGGPTVEVVQREQFAASKGATPLMIQLSVLRDECMGADGKMSAREAELYKIITDMDADKDGAINVMEVLKGATEQLEQKKRIQNLSKIAMGLFLLLAVLIFSNLGIVILANEATKDSKPDSDGVMRTTSGDSVVRMGMKDLNVNGDQLTTTNGETMRIGMKDLNVKGNQLTTTDGETMRMGVNGLNINGTQLTTTDGKTIETSEVPLRPFRLSSWLPDSAFADLKVFKAESSTGATMELAVQGWFRIPNSNPGAVSVNYVKIITSVGVIKVAGWDIQFEDTVGHLFAEAGFTTDNTKRHLLGIYELIGLFKKIDEASWVNLDLDNELPPGLGEEDAIMEYTMLFPCTSDINGCTTGLDMDVKIRDNVIQYHPSRDNFLRDDDGVAIGPAADAGYVQLHYVAEFDYDILGTNGHRLEGGAVVETIYNREWHGHRFIKYTDEEQSMTTQYYDKAVAMSSTSMGYRNLKAETGYYYCKETIAPPDQRKESGKMTDEEIIGNMSDKDKEIMAMMSSPSMNITRSAKMGEEAKMGQDGKKFTERHFEIDLQIDELSYAMLMDDMDATGYTGTLTIEYYDDKETRKPTRVLYDNGVMLIFTKYEYTKVDLSMYKAQDPRVWPELATCPEWDEDDEESNPISKMSLLPYETNYWDRSAQIHLATDLDRGLVFDEDGEPIDFRQAQSLRHLLSIAPSMHQMMDGNSLLPNSYSDLHGIALDHLAEATLHAEFGFASRHLMESYVQHLEEQHFASAHGRRLLEAELVERRAALQDTLKGLLPLIGPIDTRPHDAFVAPPEKGFSWATDSPHHAFGRHLLQLTGTGGIERTPSPTASQNDLLSQAKNSNDYSALFQSFQLGCDGVSGSSDDGTCAGNTYTETVEFDVPKVGGFEFDFWVAGCFLKSGAVGGETSIPGLTWFGSCAGTTPMLCESTWGLTCKIGLTFDCTGIAGKVVKKLVNKIGLTAEVTLEAYYSSPDLIGIKLSGTIELIVGNWWKFGISVSAGAKGVLKFSGNKYVEVSAWLSGKICFIKCFSKSITLFKKRFPFGKQTVPTMAPTMGNAPTEYIPPITWNLGNGQRGGYIRTEFMFDSGQAGVDQAVANGSTDIQECPHLLWDDWSQSYSIYPTPFTDKLMGAGNLPPFQADKPWFVASNGDGRCFDEVQLARAECAQWSYIPGGPTSGFKGTYDGHDGDIMLKMTAVFRGGYSHDAPDGRKLYKEFIYGEDANGKNQLLTDGDIMYRCGFIYHDRNNVDLDWSILDYLPNIDGRPHPMAEWRSVFQFNSPGPDWHYTNPNLTPDNPDEWSDDDDWKRRHLLHAPSPIRTSSSTSNSTSDRKLLQGTAPGYFLATRAQGGTPRLRNYAEAEIPGTGRLRHEDEIMAYCGFHGYSGVQYRREEGGLYDGKKMFRCTRMEVVLDWPSGGNHDQTRPLDLSEALEYGGVGKITMLGVGRTDLDPSPWQRMPPDHSNHPDSSWGKNYYSGFS